MKDKIEAFAADLKALTRKHEAAGLPSRVMIRFIKLVADELSKSEN